MEWEFERNCSDKVAPIGLSNIFEMFWKQYIGDNMYYKNCRKIKAKLESEGIQVKNIGRHRLYDMNLFIVNLDKVVSNKTISEALDIPKNWVDLYHYYDGNKVACIRESELLEKYGNCVGVLEFPEEEFDLREYLNAHSLGVEFREKFEELMDVELEKWLPNSTGVVLLKVYDEPQRFSLRSIRETIGLDEAFAFWDGVENSWTYVLDLRRYV